MNISILTVHEQLYVPFIETSLIGRAVHNKKLQIDVSSFFNYVQPKERIDAPIFGHGPGMLLKPNVIAQAIESKEKEYGKAFKIFFSPRGQKINQKTLSLIAEKSLECNHLMVIPSRYEGMDVRLEEEYADLIVSVGDFVLMGGDIPAMMLLEGVVRLFPGIVGKKESIEKESFNGPFVDFSSYTEPVEWNGKVVPEVLRSGNHKAVDEWRLYDSARHTVLEHFDWLRSYPLSAQDKTVAKQFIPSHYVALMHSQVLIGDEKKEGTTSVTSIDIHDIARSSKTFGIKNYFIVTPLIDQQKIVSKVLSFWKEGIGLEYNKSRYDAILNVEISASLQEAIDYIYEKEGEYPLLIATSASVTKGKDKHLITFHDQTKVWAHKRPILLIFGTGQGLSPFILDKCDYHLLPVHGFSTFNHLSVRSAVAIILDRWLGINENV